MLSTKVRSTQELMSIALQAERQTTRRYTQLAADMRDMHGDTLSRSHESDLKITNYFLVESKVESVEPARKWNLFRYL